MAQMLRVTIFALRVVLSLMEHCICVELGGGYLGLFSVALGYMALALIACGMVYRRVFCHHEERVTLTGGVYSAVEVEIKPNTY